MENRKMNKLILLSISFFLLIQTGCATFNNIQVKKPDSEFFVCVKLKFMQVSAGSYGTALEENPLDYLSQKKILNVLNRLLISTTCDVNQSSYEVKINRKSSKLYDFFIGGLSVTTVLSVGIIPSYSSQDIEISLYENDQIIEEKNYNFKAAVWLPFIVKGIRDDAYAFKNYSTDSRSAVLGIEIAEMIRNAAKGKKSEVSK
jgi:hypothetical protein